MTRVIVTRIIGGRLFAFCFVIVIIVIFVVVVVFRQFEGCSNEAVDVIWSLFLRKKTE